MWYIVQSACMDKLQMLSAVPAQNSLVDKQQNSFFLLAVVIGRIVVIVELVFYGPSTLLRSFQVWSVNLSTLFLGKPPRQFTST